MSNSKPFYLVDAFARAPFTGNPAGVVILDKELPAALMQSIAMEMNQAETAFALKTDQGWNLRWFTPAVEVDLCGHATVATAAAIWDLRAAERGKPIEFLTRSGKLTATPRGEEIELNFPSTPPTPLGTVQGLFEALGIDAARFLGRSRFDLLVEVDTEEVVRELKPDFAALRKVQVRGVIVTSKAAGQDYDFVSRFFAPAAGIDEDPVTGSAHCCLTPYWATKLGQNVLTGYQASPRGGYVEVEAAGERVFLRGGYRVTVRGELLLGD
jgi:PhzF family phenazine biosynthesis protein